MGHRRHGGIHVTRLLGPYGSKMGLVVALAVCLTLPLALPAAATGWWSAAGSMATPRWMHTATAFPNGKVLIAGGASGNRPDADSSQLTSAELYDVATKTWAPAGSMTLARDSHTASLLGNGRVLVAGGQVSGDAGAREGAELYSPTTNSWTPTASMATSRYGHTATVLSNGKVLVVGGHSTGAIFLSSAELYDPATQSWASAGAMADLRTDHTATLLGNGKVLVAGGTAGWGNLHTTAELYDPSTNTWAPAAAMTHERMDHTATRLNNGRVLVTGGSSSGGGALGSAEVYNPATNAWAPAAAPGSRSRHTATLLRNGHVLVAGGGYGGESGKAQVYDPATGSWSPGISPIHLRVSHTATALSDGTVLATGGFQSTMDGNFAVASAERYIDANITDEDGDGVVDNVDNCIFVANGSQHDANSDYQGDLCEEQHQRSLTLAFKHITVDGKRRLKLSGTLSVADTASRCTRSRQVFLARYNESTGKWDALGSDASDSAGSFVYRARDVAARYKARVANDPVTYDGFTSSCSAAFVRSRHRH